MQYIIKRSVKDYTAYESASSGEASMSVDCVYIYICVVMHHVLRCVLFQFTSMVALQIEKQLEK